ncbi:MAG: ornithine cyclodeaminase [Solirubrobacterales bacterium]|nr:ornithine cyclodeaminase [Solirubrobacterales bacterium]
MLSITNEQCAQLLDLDDVLERVSQALEWERLDRITWPTPRSLNILGDEAGNDYHVKACVLEDIPIAGVRIVCHPGDDDSGGGTRLILLIDPTTTQPIALVDESWNYAQRTVASIVVAAARVSAPDASELAIVGAGHLARTALPYCLKLLPNLKRLRVASRRPESRERFAAWAAETYGIATHATDSVEEAVREADLVLTCTSAQRPLVEDSWVSAGAVVAALDTVELTPELVNGADLFLVDSREQLAGELVQCFGEGAPDMIDATFAEVLGGVHPGRTTPSQRIVLVSQGLASQDVALAHLAYERASAEALV